ncbi:hypothetical protein D3C76_680640 [compost metagenome]
MQTLQGGCAAVFGDPAVQQAFGVFAQALAFKRTEQRSLDHLLQPAQPGHTRVAFAAIPETHLRLLKRLGEGCQHVVERLAYDTHTQVDGGRLRLRAKNRGRRQAELVAGGKRQASAVKEVRKQRVEQITLPRRAIACRRMQDGHPLKRLQPGVIGADPGITVCQCLEGGAGRDAAQAGAIGKVGSYLLSERVEGSGKRVGHGSGALWSKEADAGWRRQAGGGR